MKIIIDILAVIGGACVVFSIGIIGLLKFGGSDIVYDDKSGMMDQDTLHRFYDDEDDIENSDIQ